MSCGREGRKESGCCCCCSLLPRGQLGVEGSSPPALGAPGLGKRLGGAAGVARNPAAGARCRGRPRAPRGGRAWSCPRGAEPGAAPMAKALAQPRRRGAPPRNDRSPAPSRAPRRVSAGEGSGPPPPGSRAAGDGTGTRVWHGGGAGGKRMGRAAGAGCARRRPRAPGSALRATLKPRREDAAAAVRPAEPRLSGGGTRAGSRGIGEDAPRAPRAAPARL